MPEIIEQSLPGTVIGAGNLFTPGGQQGIPGSAGAVGSVGAPGPAGTAATIAVGSTVTGSPGSNAAVTNSGSSSAAVFNFTIPQGIQGPTGAASTVPGPPGSTGSTGPQGSAGANAWTLTTASFTVPAVGSSVTISVADASWAVVGEIVYVQDGVSAGVPLAMQVTAKTSNSLTLLNPMVSTATPIGPYVLGDTASQSTYPAAAIIVPSLVNDPDAIWAYGTYDDHFDGSSLNAKWTQTVGTGGSINVSTSRVHLYSTGAAQTKIAQAVPASSNFTISFKIQCNGGNNASNSGATSGICCVLYNGTASGAQVGLANQYSTTGSLQRFWLLNYAGANSQTPAGGTFISQSLVNPNLGPYWQFKYVTSTQATTFSFSLDGLTWIPYQSFTGSQTVFSTSAPTNFLLATYPGAAGDVSLVSIDWFKLTVP